MTTKSEGCVLTIDELASYLKIAKSMFYKLVQKGRFRAKELAVIGGEAGRQSTGGLMKNRQPRKPRHDSIQKNWKTIADGF